MSSPRAEDQRSAPDPFWVAVADVNLGVSLAQVHKSFLMRKLASDDDEEFDRLLARLAGEAQRRVREEADRFVGRVCRHLQERYSGDRRICRVLEDWVRESKDYDAFDALLCGFRFPGRERLLAEGRRRFPSALTAHWPEA